MKITLETYRDSENTYYKFSDNPYTMKVKNENVQTMEERISLFFSKASNELKTSDIVDKYIK